MASQQHQPQQRYVVRLADLRKPPSECRAAREGAYCLDALEEIQRYVPDVHSVGYFANLTKSVLNNNNQPR